ncbi:hypothetical protein BC629DRAFT_1103610 [Irpex lacteus]|nr:hypothetical protein BC629DRAFT_1103610 [Irpex lacteus]
MIAVRLMSLRRIYRRRWLRSTTIWHTRCGAFGCVATLHSTVVLSFSPNPIFIIYPQTASSSSSSSDPFDSRLSISSASASVSDEVDLPEIPFVSTIPDGEDDEEQEEDDLGTPFWLRRRPAVSTTSSSERHIAILGHAADRHHTRQRSGSLSSTASRPAPAKSILSCSSSIKTRKGRSAPSVKFLDMPTIHYEDDDDEKEQSYGCGTLPEPVYENLPPHKARETGRRQKRPWHVLGWFLSTSTKKTKPYHTSSDHRPVISSPLPLCEGRRLSNDSGRPVGSDARSIRSVRSTGSLRSVRSCASRLQGYWTRLGGKDP